MHQKKAFLLLFQILVGIWSLMSYLSHLTLSWIVYSPHGMMWVPLISLLVRTFSICVLFSGSLQSPLALWLHQTVFLTIGLVLVSDVA